MEDCSRTHELHDLNLASRKAEEAAWRRYQAVSWLQSLVGPLGISNQPSERAFISCLRNGLVLCNAINKINPGSVPKVVENQSHLQSVTWESQSLPAYQYFENVRNFLVAVEELKLPAFEASDLERDALEAGSVSKVVDCILALKSYHEWKQMGSGNGSYRSAKSPLVKHSASRMNTGNFGHALTAISSDSSRRLDMSAACEKQPPVEGANQKLEGAIVKLLADCMVDSKENIDDNFIASFRDRNLVTIRALDPVKLLGRIVSSCLEGKVQNKIPKIKDLFEERSSSPPQSTFKPLEDISALENFKGPSSHLRKGNCNHRHLFKMQEKELLDLKALWSSTKKEFEYLQSQLQRDLKDLEYRVQEMSSAASGYYRVVKENRNLYNMVQDLKGNIRVYCRIRPSFSPETKNMIDFIGEDGTLVIVDPLKPQKEGKKVFQFNRVFSPTATQDEVFKDTQPLIRSVMDGYNVCIFAYGQTGSGKTHTMSGPPGGSMKDRGINYLALNYLFQLSNKRKDVINYDIHVQMVEIYNEQVRDLLAEDSSTTKLEIRSCTSDNGFCLPNATMRTVKSTTEVLNLMKFGEVNRAVSSTAINNRSSRSHSVLTVHVHGEDISGNILRSCLHLVDLAGSERVDKSEVTGDRLKEAQYINKSLSCLGDVIMALAQKNSHIPYRNSKLTLLLQDSLGGHAKTLMFAHVSPEEDSFGETVSTLKFAQRVSTVELGAARPNRESRDVMQLKEQIESLKKALANKEAQSMQLNKTKELKSPCEKPRAVAERTPPRPRRLSIENCSTKTEKQMNIEDRKGTASVPTRSRRLSLEGPYVKKDNLQIKVSDDGTKPLSSETVSAQKYRHIQDADAVTKLYGHFSNGGSLAMNVSHAKAPRQSPTSTNYQKRFLKTDGRTQIPTLQLPKTPEPTILTRNEAQVVVIQGELSLSKESQTPNLISSTNGKGSQIRRSLRTIGKLINGSEKRNQQNLMEPRSPIKGAADINEVKTPMTANGRIQRRQSLTGIQASGSDKSRRSSLGGKPTDSNAKDDRNAKTPPPVHPSTKTMKRWL
ncbi:kinesin-like protein KIN-14L isoform X2 [Juglans microcarpa x Juglans regia]|uniref:kinesin-like protein KIN-14L isoform X2 n=1 Tax=Juglans microcarpa x Juglans regia TaxID=2249226 RepID=UPI001B7F1C9D|nr:kinesin-like protein KIN-14L isoform X2 [Juglans microcarpa x Juglans regia]